MHLHDHDVFDGCEPVAKQIRRVPKHPIGIHERWSGDGQVRSCKVVRTKALCDTFSLAELVVCLPLSFLAFRALNFM